MDVTGAAGKETLTINNAGEGAAFDDDDDFDNQPLLGDRHADRHRRQHRRHGHAHTDRVGSDITQVGVETFSVAGGGGDDIVNGVTFPIGLTSSGGGGGAANDQLTGGAGTTSSTGVMATTPSMATPGLTR